jgi:hypothetical protein
MFQAPAFDVPAVLPENPFRSRCGPKLDVTLTVCQIVGPRARSFPAAVCYWVLGRLRMIVDWIFDVPHEPQVTVCGEASLDGHIVIEFPPLAIGARSGFHVRLILPEPGDSVAVWNPLPTERSVN